jgi:hypothetical protein
MDFNIVFVRSRKKFEKFVKINKIRNKSVIDIKEMMHEENVDPTCKNNMQYFKIVVFKRIKLALSKKKDIYYIPDFDTPGFKVEKLLKIKQLLEDQTHFNLLLFHNEFLEEDYHIEDAFSNIGEFDNSKILKDY